MSFSKEVGGLIDSPAATGALYVGIIGMVLSDLLPTPADAIYFNHERILRNKWKKELIEPEPYWEKTASNYYLYNAAWWTAVGIVTALTPGSAKNKLMVLATLSGAGAIFAVLYNNIEKDKLEIERLKEAEQAAIESAQAVAQAKKEEKKAASQPQVRMLFTR